MRDKPYIGAIVIVHFYNASGDSFKFPAIVTNIHKDETINVRGFHDAGSGVVPSYNHISFSLAICDEATWHWPEKKL